MIGAGFLALVSPAMSAQTESKPITLKSINYTKYVSDSTTNVVVPVQNKKGK